MEPIIAYHIFVYGRVQGVGFRYWTVSLARAFHIAGWVRNTENDNCVELVAESNNLENLQAFVHALKTEHPYAKVDACETAKTAPANYRSFQVVR